MSLGSIPNIAYTISLFALRVSAALAIFAAVRLIIAAWTGRTSSLRISYDDIIDMARETRAVAIAFAVMLFLMSADGMYVGGMPVMVACSILCRSYAVGMCITLALTFVSRLVAAFRSTRTTSLAQRRDALASMSFWGAIVCMFLAFVLW